MNTIEREAVRLTAMLAATEKWPEFYSRTPKQHGDLINAEAELQVVLTRMFRDMAKRASAFVNWDQYNFQRSRQNLGRDNLDYNVEVVVNDQQVDDWDGTFMKVTINTVKKSVVAGIAASELNYHIPFGVPSTSSLIQNLTTKEVANLVGKKVLDDGSIIDNPNPEYNIMETVRKDIAESIKTSLGLGETTDEAALRIAEIINPIERAELIAQTESVRAYNQGVDLYGAQTKAVGEEWMDAGAVDVCADYARRGPQPFGTGWDALDGPPAHPRCRCAKRLIYAEEWDRIARR